MSFLGKIGRGLEKLGLKHLRQAFSASSEQPEAQNGISRPFQYPKPETVEILAEDLQGTFVPQTEHHPEEFAMWDILRSIADIAKHTAPNPEQAAPFKSLYEIANLIEQQGLIYFIHIPKDIWRNFEQDVPELTYTIDLLQRAVDHNTRLSGEQKVVSLDAFRKVKSIAPYGEDTFFFRDDILNIYEFSHLLSKPQDELIAEREKVASFQKHVTALLQKIKDPDFGISATPLFQERPLD